MGGKAGWKVTINDRKCYRIEKGAKKRGYDSLDHLVAGRLLVCWSLSFHLNILSRPLSALLRQKYLKNKVVISNIPLSVFNTVQWNTHYKKNSILAFLLAGGAWTNNAEQCQNNSFFFLYDLDRLFKDKKLSISKNCFNKVYAMLNGVSIG
jgi:hypothetical protein